MTHPAIRKPVTTPVQAFIQTEAASGVILGLSAILALIVANSPAQHTYEHLLHVPIGVRVGSYGLELGLAHWINDGLMAIFFLLVGLEIKREIKYGELSDTRSAMLPVAAAFCGAVIPAAIYLAFCYGTEFQSGWAIPMATDIAFAMGVLALLGKRMPSWAKIFLMASAVVDDLIAVLVIAFFYTENVDVAAMLWAAGLLVLLAVMNFLGVRMLAWYLLAGACLWLAFLASGVHATIAGVLLGFMIPSFRRKPLVESMPAGDLSELISRTPDGSKEEKELFQAALNEIEDQVIEAESPLHRLEHSLHPIVAFGIMPVFAFANAGVAIEPSAVTAALSSKMTLGIALGLILGKQIGIVGAWALLAWLGKSTVELGRESLRIIHGLSLLAGIGFTMSLFVGGLAFGQGPVFEQAKLAILGASLISGLTGYILLRGVKPPQTA